jgi:RecA-family ATPase
MDDDMSGDAYLDELPPLDAYADNVVVAFPGAEPDIGQQPEREPLPLIDPSEWAGEPPERRWAVDGMVPHAQATLLTGAGSAGKSLVMQLQCTCVALGLPWLGIATEQAVSIYVSCEDDEAELWRRQKAICDSLGVTLADLSGKLFLLSLVGRIDNELAIFDSSGRLSVCDRYRDLQDACARVEARHLALDNTGHFYSGNENDRHQVAGFVGLLNALAALINGSVIIIGHPNKAGAEYSGSTAWENQVRSRLFMEIPTDDDGNATEPDMRVIRKGKANYSQKGEELRFMWHKWSFVLPDSLADDDRTTVGQVARDNTENERFLICLEKATSERRTVSSRPAASNYAPKAFAKMTLAKGMSPASFAAAMERLLHLGIILADTPVFKRDNRTIAMGIGLAEKCTNHCTNPAQSGAQSGAQTRTAQEAQRCTAQHPSTTYIGPALGAGLSMYEDEPPNWMDEAPPPDPDSYGAEPTGDFRDNPLFDRGR